MRRITERTWGETEDEMILFQQQVTEYHDSPPRDSPSSSSGGTFAAIVIGAILGGLLGALLSR